MQFEPLNIPLVDLKDDDSECREVVSADGVVGLFCGHPTLLGSSYCPHHHQINWVRVPAIRPRVRAA